MTTFKARGKPLEDTNKYVRIWQKLADGSWKLARVIFNSNSPLPQEEE
jgi:ketosteroid isomerase-like protein